MHMLNSIRIRLDITTLDLSLSLEDRARLLARDPFEHIQLLHFFLFFLFSHEFIRAIYSKILRVTQAEMSFSKRCDDPRTRNPRSFLPFFYFFFFFSFFYHIHSFFRFKMFDSDGKICRNLYTDKSNKFPKTSRHFTPWIRREDDRTTYFFSLSSLKNLFSFDSRKYHDQIYHCFMGLDIFLLIFMLSFSELRLSFSYFFFFFRPSVSFLYVFFFRFFVFCFFFFFFFLFNLLSLFVTILSLTFKLVVTSIIPDKCARMKEGRGKNGEFDAEKRQNGAA